MKNLKSYNVTLMIPGITDTYKNWLSESRYKRLTLFQPDFKSG